MAFSWTSTLYFHIPDTQILLILRENTHKKQNGDDLHYITPSYAILFHFFFPTLAIACSRAAANDISPIDYQ